MAKLSHVDSRRMYSWWWDSHISPKNSKWLQENLTDMDAKVKAMIKVIEEDADSFARRAEMYYKKRPELMKLVEELYRAYRALAERYDHATGVIRQAHKTMAEAFPNQVPLSFIDDSPASIACDELQMEYSFDVKRNGAFAEDSQNHHLFEGDADKKSGLETLQNLCDLKAQVCCEAEIQTLKEASLQQCLDTVKLGERANKAEVDVQSLRDDIAKIATEKDEALKQYVQAEEDARKLKRADSEVETLRQSVSKLSEEKEAAAVQYQKCLETISSLEGKLSSAQEQTQLLNADKNMEFGRLWACVQEERLRFVEVETDNQRLHDEVMKLQEENKNLIQLNLSSSLKGLQDENSNLKEMWQREKSEKEVVLENFLSDTGAEMKAVREKLKALEFSCQSLSVEKSTLLDEKGALVGQLQFTTENTILEKENHAALNKIEKLQISLDVEKHEHESSIHKSERQMACLKSEMHLLQQECERRKREFEEAADKALDSQIEIFILQESVQELEAKNISLFTKYQRLLKASTLSEQKYLKQQAEAKSMYGQASILRKGMHKLLKVLNVVLDHDRTTEDQTYLHHVLRRVEDIKESLCKTEEENQQLAVQVLVLVTLLEKLKLEKDTEKSIIEQELRIRSHQFSMLQNEVVELREMKSKLKEKESKENLLEFQIENVGRKLMTLQVAYDNLERENSKLHEDKRSLSKEFSFLEETRHILEQENYAICGELLSLDSLSLVFKNYMKEKSLQIKTLVSDINKLHEVCGETTEKLSSIKGMLEEVKIENLSLKNTLQKVEDELNTARFVNDQLNHDIQIGKDLLFENELKLQEIGQKLSLTENERLELYDNLEHLRSEHTDAKRTTVLQEKQIEALSAECEHLSTDNGNLREANLLLDNELHHLREDNGKTKKQKEALHSELLKQINEIHRLESEMEKLFRELYMYMCYYVLYEQKVSELMARHERFEAESTSNDINLLRERLSILDVESNTRKTQLATCCAAIVSLSKCISSLEKHKPGKLQEPDNEANLVANFHFGNNPKENESSISTDVVSDLQGLEARVQAIKKALIEMKQVEEQKNVSMQVAMKQIEELKSKNHVHRKSGVLETENGMFSKDIMLDQISDCSPYSTGKRESVEADNHTLELWDTADWNKSIGLTVYKARLADPPITGKNSNSRRKSVKKLKSGSEAVDEELGVDKSEVSKRSMDLQERNKRKVLERLNSDVQKLMNLQITVQDLKSKLETTEKSRRGKAAVVECETLKGQLNDAMAAMNKLFDLSGKLMKNLEAGSSSAVELEENESVGRRRISEQARRVSEKIGVLQLEVQKLHFALLKLDDERDCTDKTRISEEKRRVLLRDYLYGVRTRERRKKATCCACCIQPSTQGD